MLLLMTRGMGTVVPPRRRCSWATFRFFPSLQKCDAHPRMQGCCKVGKKTRTAGVQRDCQVWLPTAGLWGVPRKPFSPFLPLQEALKKECRGSSSVAKSGRKREQQENFLCTPFSVPPAAAKREKRVFWGHPRPRQR